MRVFERLGRYNHEKVLFCNDNATGLRAIIAVHDTTLGPALGRNPHAPPTAPTRTPLRTFSACPRGMTYKAAIAGLDLGGAKTVVTGDPRSDKNPALLRALGRFIESMGGEYVAGQDIGTNSHDMAVVREATRHVTCVHPSAGGAGDPSYVTAYGVTCGIRAVLKATTGRDSLEGRAHRCTGGWGTSVTRSRATAPRPERDSPCATSSRRRWSRPSANWRPTPSRSNRSTTSNATCFSPNAVGGVLNDDTIPRLRCPAVAGGANNVLAEARHVDALVEHQIVYGPDYLVNSGGVIRCQEEIAGRPTDDTAIFAKTGRIYKQTLDVISAARREGVSSAVAADRIAEKRIAAEREAD